MSHQQFSAAEGEPQPQYGQPPNYGQPPQYGQPYREAPAYGEAPHYWEQPAYGQGPHSEAYGQGPHSEAYGQGPHSEPYGQGPHSEPYGQSPHSEPYGQRQHPGYGQQVSPYQPYGQPAYAYPGLQPEHPQAQSVLVLGIVGLFVPIVSYIAWYMGSKAKKEINAGAPFAWGSSLKVGYILGWVFSILWSVGIGLYALMIIASIIFMASL